MAGGNSISSVLAFIDQARQLYPQTASDISARQNSLDDIRRHIEKLRDYAIDLNNRAQAILDERTRVTSQITSEESRLAQLQSRRSDDDKDKSNSPDHEIQQIKDTIRDLQAQDAQLSHSFDSTMAVYNDVKNKLDTLTGTAGQLQSALQTKRSKCAAIAATLFQNAALLNTEAQAVKAQANAFGSISSMHFGASASYAGGSRSAREQELLRYENEAQTQAQMYHALAGGEVSSSAQHRQAIAKRLFSASNPFVLNLYNKHAASVQFEDDHYEGTAYYSPSSGKISLNVDADAQNPKGAGTTYFHEVGHMIDHKSGSGKWLSSNSQYGLALRSDVENHISSVMDIHSCSREQAYDIISEELEGIENHSLSDMFGSMTNCQCQGDWGHRPGYWNADPEAYAKEAFAHMFEASIGSPEKVQRIQKYFPRAYSVFESIIRRA